MALAALLWRAQLFSSFCGVGRYCFFYVVQVADSMTKHAGGGNHFFNGQADLSSQ